MSSGPLSTRSHTQCIVLPIGIAHMYTGQAQMRAHFSQTQLHVWLQKYLWRQFALTTEDAASAVFPTFLGVQGFGWLIKRPL